MVPQQRFWTSLLGISVLLMARICPFRTPSASGIVVYAFSTTLPLRSQSRGTLLQHFNLDPSLHVEEKIEEPKKQFDKNGQEFGEGQTVRVSRAGLKAYQVPKKGKGSFEGNAFVPDTTLPYLLVPVGMRGVVTQVIDTQVLSANFPIRVKFEPDDGTTADKDECCPPVSFVMHFGPQEVEIV